MQVAINEAAEIMQVSADTIRRRIKRNQIKAFKKNGVWTVDIEEPDRGEVESLKELVKVLQTQLDARTREISELHILLQRVSSLSGPPGAIRLPWYKRLLGIKRP